MDVDEIDVDRPAQWHEVHHKIHSLTKMNRKQRGMRSREYSYDRSVITVNKSSIGFIEGDVERETPDRSRKREKSIADNIARSASRKREKSIADNIARSASRKREKSIADKIARSALEAKTAIGLSVSQPAAEDEKNFVYSTSEEYELAKAHCTDQYIAHLINSGYLTRFSLILTAVVSSKLKSIFAPTTRGL
ncbi:hypothetical protein DAPPUDRAFT_265067 [Daphnia pulex]|uniref:Uncharacterized protein n=1 Tax=Daphnia pulex TaxID=6669 RepID=E9HST7_DAPPU|nr:hypothetical protein DAPPUDRAFT_265067 [Daphnia pulex]|eukprot:EFX65195.1 hypothetical protein DAPPUDRAFT_265067 [Daphnia pulex]